MGNERSHAARNTELLGEAGFCWDWPYCVPPRWCALRLRQTGRVKSIPWIEVPINRKGCGYQCSGGGVSRTPQLVTNCTLSVIPPQRKAMVSVILAM